MTKIRVSARAIIMEDGKLLLVKQKPQNDTPAKFVNVWATPGGGIEEGESIISCLEREIIEELGVKAEIGNLLYIQQFFLEKENLQFLEFFFHVSNSKDFLNIDLSSTSHGMAEIAEVKFIDPSLSNVLPVFLRKENIAAKIKSNSPVSFFSYL